MRLAARSAASTLVVLGHADVGLSASGRPGASCTGACARAPCPGAPACAPALRSSCSCPRSGARGAVDALGLLALELVSALRARS
eukprot:2137511-Alexandrium_andersonii.AAC.1